MQYVVFGPQSFKITCKILYYKFEVYLCPFFELHNFKSTTIDVRFLKYKLYVNTCNVSIPYRYRELTKICTDCQSVISWNI